MRKSVLVFIPCFLLAFGFGLLSSLGADELNLSTGAMLMNLGGGDQMNLSTGEMLMNLGGGD